MRSSLGRYKIFQVTGLLMLIGLVSLLQACGSSASTSGTTTVTIAYQQFGPPPYYTQDLLNTAKQQFEAAHPDIKIKLEPIVADEGSYYTKLALMQRSAATAPDVVNEDSFQIGADVTAGYLAPLDKYLDAWPDYKNQWYPTMQQMTQFQGHNYGIMQTTDVQTIWYNKDLFKKAGLPTDWQPKSWADILSAAQTVKANVPGVIPMNIYSGIPMNEASTLRGMWMLLYGTPGGTIYDYKTNKWVASSAGLLDSLKFIKQVYDPKDRLGPPDDIALSTQAGNSVANELLPQGKLAIALDGSWLPSIWASSGTGHWSDWQQTMGVAKMPTENGQTPGYLSFSGGWSYAVSAKSTHQQEAVDFLKTVLSKDNLGKYVVQNSVIPPRKDIATLPNYTQQPLASYFANQVNITNYRPALPAYPKISVQVDSTMQQVMSGQASPEDALKTFDQAVTGIAGPDNVERNN